jgi:hypothetical protein
MTEKEIIQGNRAIAEFMKHHWLDAWANSTQGRQGQLFPYEQLKYHTSWDWLMPVVEKINKTKLGNEHFDVIIYKADCQINNSLQIIFERGIMGKGETLIEITWLAVADFIKWHNQQTQLTCKH